MNVCINNKGPQDVLIETEMHDAPIHLNISIEKDARACIELKSEYVSGDEVTLITKKGTILTFELTDLEEWTSSQESPWVSIIVTSGIIILGLMLTYFLIITLLEKIK